MGLHGQGSGLCPGGLPSCRGGSSLSGPSLSAPLPLQLQREKGPQPTDSSQLPLVQCSQPLDLPLQSLRTVPYNATHRCGGVKCTHPCGQPWRRRSRTCPCKHGPQPAAPLGSRVLARQQSQQQQHRRKGRQRQGKEAGGPQTQGRRGQAVARAAAAPGLRYSTWWCTAWAHPRSPAHLATRCALH